MCLFGTGLVAAAPDGPLQDMLDGRRWLPDEREEEAAHLGYRQGEQLDERHPIVRPRSVACRFLTVRPPVGPCWAGKRTTVR